jgi:hypothetical protein
MCRICGSSRARACEVKQAAGAANGDLMMDECQFHGGIVRQASAPDGGMA